jgi:copper chaperone CopZ
MTTTVYEVQGMTCEHCVRAVSGEVAKLDAVEGVEIDLASGLGTVTRTVPIGADQVAAAVDEAGYELVA